MSRDADTAVATAAVTGVAAFALSILTETAAVASSK